MSFLETLRTALSGVASHRLRSVLTMLGILIGIAAVILTVGLGQGAQAQVRAQIDKLGSNLLIVSPGSATSSGFRLGRGSASTLTMRDAQALSTSSVAPDIARVAPVSSASLALAVGSATWTTTVVGTLPDWLEVRARSVSDGRFFTADEVASAREVMVLGSTTAAQLFGGRSALGQQVAVGGSTLTVIGVLGSVGSSATADEDDQAVVPRSTFASRLSTAANRSSLSSLYLEAASKDSLSAAYQEADRTLLTLHGVTPANADFTVSSQQSLLTTATATDRTLTVLLAGVAGISLLVGGLGVMNIMLVSVTERVREIGLRKALGATPAAIRRQFLLEASTLGLLGGLLGVGLALVGAATLPAALNQPVSLSALAIVGAVSVSLLIGVVAGVYPAARAAALAPIDALRSE